MLKKGGKMFTSRRLLLVLSVIFFFLWTMPVDGSVISGPELTLAEKGWKDFGLVFRAEADVTLVSVGFPNQGLADVINLIRDSDSAVLASIPVTAGNTDAIVTINYPLAAQEVYRLVATTMSNKYYAASALPAGYEDITVLGSVGNLGGPFNTYWFSFNDITTEQSVIDPEIVIDIKPGSDVNSINLKSKGVVSVAILTTEDFDALDVDPESVIFAEAHPVRWHIEDIDGDGYDDMLLQFNTQELTGLSAESTDARLDGTALDGTITFFGVDTVNIVHGK
jgi:hypothetical protein